MGGDRKDQMKNCDKINSSVLREGLLFCTINKAWVSIICVKSREVMKDLSVVH